MKPSREKGGSRVEKFDPVIGISVIVLTLVIMLVWGRLCAILCTSAWCYFLPRLRDAAALAKRKRSGSDGSVCAPDLNSESYKKKSRYGRVSWPAKSRFIVVTISFIL